RPFYARPVRYRVQPYHAIPESRRMPIVGSPPRLGHPQVTPPQRIVDRARVMAPRAEATPTRQMPESRRMPMTQNAPTVAPRAQVTAPLARSMPAPQARMSERPNGVGHSGSAQANVNRGGGWKHRGDRKS